MRIKLKSRTTYAQRFIAEPGFMGKTIKILDTRGMIEVILELDEEGDASHYTANYNDHDWLTLLEQLGYGMMATRIFHVDLEATDEEETKGAPDYEM